MKRFLIGLVCLCALVGILCAGMLVAFFDMIRGWDEA